MNTIEIEEPHGYLLDSDGNVVKRFGNWITGRREVQDEVVDVKYVNGPAAHDTSLHWLYGSGIPPVDLSLSSDEIINGGDDEVAISMLLDDDAEDERGATLTVAGSDFSETLEPGAKTIETVTTTQSEGSVIEIKVDGDNVQRATADIEVIES